MSRWNKGRVQTFALPLDALVKEKENTNRPIAARSAGTVGKWGITSFTSIRGPTYGYSSFSPKQELTHQNISPHSGETHASQAAQPSDAPKPKKFFKSRNVVPPTGNLTPPTQVEPIQLNTVPKISLKVNKKLLNPNDEVRKTKVEKSAKPKKVKKLKDETKLSVEKPTRFLSRTRKAVNYIEEHSRSPTPNYVALIDEHMALAERVSEEAMETTTTDRKEPSTDTSNVLPIAEDALEIATKAVAQVTHDHPPIVLRISKGTSRLISTDSEEVIRSPASQSPLQQPPTVANPSGSLTTTAELLAVLSDDPPAQENVIPEEPVAPPVEHKPEGIKIKIKKHLAQAFITSNGNDAKPVVPPVARRNTRAARRTQLEEVVKNETMKDNSPQPGNENYELYRTLASPAEDKDFDSQSSVLGSISSVCVPSGVPEDSQVIHSRGSSHVSSEDADDQEETSQDSSLLAAPSEIDTRLATMMDYEVETPPSKPVETKVLPKRNTRSRVKSPQQTVSEIVKPPEPEVMERRSTRNNNNGMLQKSTVEELSRPPIKSYGRKRKTTKQDESSNNEPSFTSNETTDPTLLPPPTVPVSQSSMNSSPDQNKIHNSSEHKVYRKVRKINMDDVSTDSNKYANNNLSMGEDEKPSVKLVISKKKGSIFKSRAIAAANSEGENKKRHVYKHKWDDDSKDKTIINDPAAKPVNSDAYYNDFDEDGESSGLLTRVTRQRSPQNYDESEMTSVKCDTKAKKFYTVVRNVKKAHQIQEIGEFQEMDDDVEYILDALQSQNPMSTRCLSAIQLASKCMTPAFRMHLRAHGTITKFFKALHDASKDQSLGLCTATVMFVLNQDNLNMDLDRDSLELMLNLLESDVSHTNALDDCGLTKEQLQRNKSKVRELCAEIKNQGKAVHLNLDNITVGTLAMETLLSLTSKRAGEWFKEELRELGGLEHIIVTICECCRQISDYVVDWTEALLEKLRKIERCLRVLENVSTQNEENQSYILSYKNGHAVDTLVNFYKLCDSEIALYPTNDQTPKDNPGIVLREALVPTLKVLINLTHPFNEKSAGSAILGEKLLIFDTSLHLLLQAPHYVPEGCIFELSILVLLLLINLTMYTLPNRIVIMKANAPSDHNQFNKVPAIKALIEYFYKCEEMARLVEQNTDDILDNPNKAERKTQSQEEVEETVTKLLQKAGHHMEHTMLASYVCILVGHLVIDCNDHEQDIRRYLINGQFTEMVQILEKYYNFMNLTASYEASHVAHIKQTKMIIDYLKKSDKHSTSTSSDNENLPLVATSQSATSANNKQPTYSTYSSSNSSAASSTFFSNRGK